MCICTHMHAYRCIHMCTHTYMHMCVYIYTQVCVYVCVCVFNIGYDMGTCISTLDNIIYLSNQFWK